MVELILGNYERNLTTAEKAALVNRVNTDGRSALHIAAAAGQAELLAYLSHNEGDLFLKDKFGVSPWDIVITPGTTTPASRGAPEGITISSRKQLYQQ